MNMLVAKSEPRIPGRVRHFSLPQAVECLAAGTLVTAIDYQQVVTTVDGERAVHASTEYWSQGTGTLPQHVADVVATFDLGQDRRPETIDEVAAAFGVSVACLCEYVTRQLVSQGRLSLEEVATLYETVPSL